MASLAAKKLLPASGLIESSANELPLVTFRFVSSRAEGEEIIKGANVFHTYTIYDLHIIINARTFALQYPVEQKNLRLHSAL